MSKTTQTISHTSISNSFSIYYQNCRGLNSKINSFFLSMLSADYDVIAVTESWLKPNVLSSELFGNSYFVFRCDRSILNSNKKHGGGVIIAVKTKFSCERINLVECDKLEIVIVKIVFNQIALFIICVYIPSESSLQVYESVILCINSFYSSSHFNIHDKVVLVGDFNISVHSWIPHEEISISLVPVGVGTFSSFFDSIQLHGLFQINWVCNFMGRNLDLAYVNCYDDVCVVKSEFTLVKIDPFHVPFEITFNFPTFVSYPLNEDQYEYDFRQSDFSSLNQYFINMSWDNIFLNANLNDIISNLYELFYVGFNLFVPKVKSRSRTSNSHPVWFDRQILNLRNRKSKAYKKIGTDPTAYNNIRREYKSLLKLTYQKYIDKTQQNLVNDPKSFWKFVNSTKKSSSLPVSMQLNSRRANSLSECCDLFSTHFSNAYLCDDSSISDSIFDKNIPEHLPIGNIRITSDEVLYALLHLNKNKGKGPDGIPAIFYINCAQSLAVPLCRIFNTSLACGQFPDKWKKSFILPIFKSGSRCDVKNYRGVSITSTIAKLFESLVTNALTNHFCTYISVYQHAYMKGRSTTTNLVQFVHTTNLTLTKNKQLDVIYTDFSKAFDRVDHSCLIRKLSLIGVHSSLLTWIRSFLSNRTQCVKLLNCLSSEFLVTSGVPQGSHIGPLLFVLFINDLIYNLTYSGCLIYADDVKLFMSVNCIDDMLNFQRDLNILSSWCVHNRLTLNVSKCKHISFYRHVNHFRSHYHLESKKLETLTEIRDLGVYFCHNLNFSHHVDAVVSKAYSMLGFVKRVCRDFTSNKALTSVYIAHVRSHLEYASIVWNPNQITHSNRIESVQKQFILFALRRQYPRRNYDALPSYTFRCDILTLPVLSVRRNLSYVLFIYDILSGKVDACDIISELNFFIPARYLRSNNIIFRIPFLRLEFSRSDPLIVMCSLCNLINNNLNLNLDFDIPRNSFIRIVKPIVSSL